MLMFTFSKFQFIRNCPKWHLKNQFFLLLHTACISLALPLSLLPFTRDTHIVCLQWNISQCVQIWIFKHFKHIIICTNNISLIQILLKVKMRFFFLSVYVCLFFLLRRSQFLWGCGNYLHIELTPKSLWFKIVENCECYNIPVPIQSFAVRWLKSDEWKWMYMYFRKLHSFDFKVIPGEAGFRTDVFQIWNNN